MTDGRAACAATAQELARRAYEDLGAAGVNIMQSSGSAAWQTVFHLHFHVIPRYADDPLVLPWKPTGAIRLRSQQQRHSCAGLRSDRGAHRPRREPAAASRAARGAPRAAGRRARCTGVQAHRGRRRARDRARAGGRGLPGRDRRRVPPGGFQDQITDACDGFDGVGIDAWLWGDWHSDDRRRPQDRAPGRARGRPPARAAPRARGRGARVPARHDGAHREDRPCQARRCSRTSGRPSGPARPTPPSTRSSRTSRRSSCARCASSPGSAAATSSSTRRTTRCSSTLSGARSTRRRGWPAESGSRAGSSSTTR